MLCKGLEGKPLQAVNLSDNALGEKGVRACLPVFAELDPLQSIDFNNNGISGECAEVRARVH